MSEKTFELGLVGAGAISAGAYTAGVIDFLIQALDAWYLRKANDRNVPQHDVKLSVFSGASAGAITAALAAGYIGSHQKPIATEEEGDGETGTLNKLFDSWVNRIDIKHLLETKDLDQGGNVLSLLDSSVLWDIANSGLDVVPRDERRPYIPESFDLLMTVTNLRGVPYGFEVIGDQPTDYDMSLHADHVHFHLSDTGHTEEKYRYGMKWNDFGSSVPIKEKLKMAALASGAFPVGLAPRVLNHEIIPKVSDYYSARQWPIPTPHSENPHFCTTMGSIEAKWGIETLLDYQFQCVDGGVMNNEPLELARRILAGDAGRNDRRGEFAKKAVLLIDPFPNNSTFDSNYEPASDLFKSVTSLFEALKNQARFKPDELELARNPDVYSRFMIAPKRSGTKGNFHIASGLLGGFGGFLSRKFRSHDFFLGRRNAQKFLRDHLVLPENNSLFDDWTRGMKQTYCVKDAKGVAIKDKDGHLLLPIIPLVESVDINSAPCFEPQWPLYTYDELNMLTQQIESRISLVFDRLVAQYFQSNNLIVRWIAKIIIGRKKNDTVEYVRQVIKDDLIRMEWIEEVK
jgi:predicted acylesterase/phospholipase RssA